jgi:hypothetical protein
LSTDKPSRLWKNNLKRRFELDEFPSQHPTGIAKNIYITNDEEPKSGDWCYNSIENTVYQKKIYQISFAYEYKIILTTDPDLIADGVQAIPDEFLEWFVKNPNCEFVKVIGELDEVDPQIYVDYSYNYKIIIPKEEANYNMKQEILDEMKRIEEQKQKVICTNDVCQGECGSCNFMTLVNVEEPKQETLEEVAERMWNDPNEELTSKISFIKGAKWQQEQDKKMYSELVDLLERLRTIYKEDCDLDIKYDKKRLEFIEQFKNK